MTIDVARVVEHQHRLLATGRTASTTREALIALSGVMQVAAEHGLIPGNPVRAVRKPTAVKDEVQPLRPTSNSKR